MEENLEIVSGAKVSKKRKCVRRISNSSSDSNTDSQSDSKNEDSIRKPKRKQIRKKSIKTKSKQNDFIDGSNSDGNSVVTEESIASGSKQTTLKHFFTNKSNNNEKETNIVDEAGEEVSVVSSKKTQSNEGNGPFWEGQRLYPPAKKSGPRSIVWDYSGFLKTKTGVLDTSHVICGLCGISKVYRHSPSAILQHLDTYHKAEFNKDKGERIASVENYFSKVKTKKYAPSNPKQKKGREKIIHWICRSNRPLTIVEDQSFKEYSEILDPQFTVPCRRTVTNDIEKLYKVTHKKVVEELAPVQFFAGTNDAGSSYDVRNFIDINVHYITEEFDPKKVTLGVIEMKMSKNAENYRKLIKDKEEMVGISGKVISYTTDNERTMKKCFKNDERNGCFAHIESKSCQKALNNVSVLNKLRKKMRKIARKSNKSNKFKYALERNQKLRGLNTLTIKQEVKTRFTSTHILFGSILNDPNRKNEEKPDKGKIMQNIESINKSLEDAKVKDRESLKIGENEVDKMIQVMKVLDTLEEAITLLGGEKYSTGSVVLPFEKKIMDIIEDNEDDPFYMYEFKKILREDMKTRCDECLNRDLLSKSAFFDGRFKDLKFLEEGKRSEIVNEIEDEVKEFEAKGQFVKEKEREKNIEKKSRFLGANLEDGDSDEENVETEIKRYQAEKKLKTTHNPFDFWKAKKNDFPRLAFLAKKYLCVQVM